MRRTQKNSKRKIKKKKRKAPLGRSFLPRLEGPSNNSNSERPSVTKSFGSKLPHLGVSVRNRKPKVNDSYSVDTRESITILPSITHKRKQKIVSSEKGLNGKVNDYHDEEESTGAVLKKRQNFQASIRKENLTSQKQKFSSSLDKKEPKTKALSFYDKAGVQVLQRRTNHHTANGKNYINSEKKQKCYSSKEEPGGRIVREDKKSEKRDSELVLQRPNNCTADSKKGSLTEKKQKYISSIKKQSKLKPFNATKGEKSKTIEQRRLQSSNLSIFDGKTEELEEKAQKRLTSKKPNGKAPDCIKRIESRVCDLLGCKKEPAEGKNTFSKSTNRNSKEKAQHCLKDDKFEEVRIETSQKHLKEITSHATGDHLKEGVNLIEVYSNPPKYISSELKILESGLDWINRDSGISDNIDGIDLTNIKAQTEEVSENINKSITTENVGMPSMENKESGLNHSKESGIATSVMNTDEGFCEHDFIFEEIVDVNLVNTQKYHKTKQRAQTVTKSLSRKPPNLESGLHANEDFRNILTTKEFKVEGLEINLRKFPPHERPKKVPFVPSKPKICRQKVGIEGSNGIQGHKVKGFSFDVDEYVISMVRLANCNDNVNHEEMRGFPCSFYQEFS